MVHGGYGGGGVYIVSEEWCIYVFLDLLRVSNHLAEMRIKGSNREILLGVQSAIACVMPYVRRVFGVPRLAG
jgi:hypothetical protein